MVRVVIVVVGGGVIVVVVGGGGGASDGDMCVFLAIEWLIEHVECDLRIHI